MPPPRHNVGFCGAPRLMRREQTALELVMIRASGNDRVTIGDLSRGEQRRSAAVGSALAQLLRRAALNVSANVANVGAEP